MFKNYLTFQFAQNFDRACRSSEIPTDVQGTLATSSEKMLDHFARSLSSANPSEELKLLSTALLCIRDCREILERSDLRIHEIDSRYEVLHRRLEQLVLAAFEAQGERQRTLIRPVPDRKAG